MLNRFKKSGEYLISANTWRVVLVFWGGAILVGLAAAIFAIASEHANGLFRELLGYSPYWPLVITPIGMAVIAWMTLKFFPGAQGSGIPQAIAAIEIADHEQRSRLLNIRIAIGKIILTLGGLLCGASIGREGPTVHIGASVMYSLGNLAKFPAHYLERGLILAGGAAGISAAFNTPLAGILFAIEEMNRSFEQRTSGTLISAVVIAGLTAIALLGNYTYFGITEASFDVLGSDWAAVFVCGILCGVLGGLFSYLLVRSTRWVRPFYNRRPLLIAAACGLAIAVIGLLSNGHSYGTGYTEAKMLVTGSGELEASFPFLKMLATIVSYLSGIPGGIFAPSLATGAGLGTMISGWFPGMEETAVVMLAMVGFFSGVVQTPLTAFVIVMEMTANQALILPLMLTAFISYGVSRIINAEAIYAELAKPFLESARPKPAQPPPAPVETDHLV